MTHRFALVAQLAVLALGSAASAHGDGVHIMGKVRSVSETSLTVEAKDGKDQTFSIDSKTKVERDGAAAAVRDIAGGQRVVVHARKDGETLIAQLIKLGKATKPTQKPDGGTKEEHHDHSNH